jgi:hypothetical protein
VHPKFENLITEDWIEGALRRGTWTEDHGSDVDRWIDDLRAGDLLPRFEFPPHLASSNELEIYSDQQFRDVLRSWLRVRYGYVVKQLQATDIERVGRRMSVDDDWLAGIYTGASKLGVYFGDLPLDQGEFWYDENQANDVYLEVSIIPEDIDWEATILARMDYTTGDEEREVCLKEDRTVVINRLCLNGETISLPPDQTASTGVRWSRPGATATLRV